MPRSKAKSSKLKGRKKLPPIYIRIAYGLLQRKPGIYSISEMTVDLFNFDSKALRNLTKSHFYHARNYLETTYGELVVPVRLGGREIAGYKCADAENEEDVKAVKHEILRRGILSESTAAKFQVGLEAVTNQGMLKGGQFSQMTRMIEGEVEVRNLKKEEQFELHGFRPEEVIPMDKLGDDGNMKMAVTLYAESIHPTPFVMDDVKMALEASGIRVKSEGSLRSTLLELSRAKGTLTKTKTVTPGVRGKHNVYVARTGASS